MKTSLFTVGLMLAVGAGLAGCNSFDSRAKEKAYVFNDLSPEVRQRLKAGEIHVGDSTDMVYIALGKPTDRLRKTTADGETSTWLYKSYDRDYEGEAFVGYRRHVVYDRLTRTYRVYHQPVTASVYSERQDDRFRVTFKDGQVTEIETTGE